MGGKQAKGRVGEGKELKREKAKGREGERKSRRGEEYSSDQQSQIQRE
jgi:hypothetical protein